MTSGTNNDMDNCTRITLIDAAKTLGEGDIGQGVITIKAIAERLKHARKKHPVFAPNKKEAWGAMFSEIRELKHALAHENDERQKDEALDIIVTNIRFYNGEWKHE